MASKPAKEVPSSGKTIVDGKGSSHVWQFFGFYEVAGVVDKTKTVCKLCKMEYKYNGNTSNMNSHLLRSHRSVTQSKNEQPTIAQCVSKKKQLSRLT